MPAARIAQPQPPPTDSLAVRETPLAQVWTQESGHGCSTTTCRQHVRVGWLRQAEGLTGAVFGRALCVLATSACCRLPAQRGQPLPSLRACPPQVSTTRRARRRKASFICPSPLPLFYLHVTSARTHLSSACFTGTPCNVSMPDDLHPGQGPPRPHICQVRAQFPLAASPATREPLSSAEPVTHCRNARSHASPLTCVCIVSLAGVIPWGSLVGAARDRRVPCSRPPFHPHPTACFRAGRVRRRRA